MDSLNRITQTNLKSWENINTLNLNKFYKIFSAKIVNTKYGKKVLIELQDVCVFLPKRYSDAVTEDIIENFNKGEYGVVIIKTIIINTKTSPVLEFKKVRFKIFIFLRFN